MACSEKPAAVCAAKLPQQGDAISAIDRSITLDAILASVDRIGYRCIVEPAGSIPPEADLRAVSSCLQGLANELDLETPVAKIYGFLENLKRKGKFSKVEVEQLQTLLVTSDNLKVGGPCCSASVEGTEVEWRARQDKAQSLPLIQCRNVQTGARHRS